MRYRIKELRQSRGWSQEHLAELAGTSKGYISQLESGKREPSAETLRSLAAAFGVDATGLIESDTHEGRELNRHLALFQRLSPEDQAAVMRIVQGMASGSSR